MQKITSKQIKTLNRMISWVSFKKLRNNGFDEQKIMKVQKNLRNVKLLIMTGYIKKFNDNSQTIQNIFTYLSNLLNKQTYNKMHVIGKDTKPYYARDSFYKKLAMQKKYYQKHGHWLKF